MRHCLAGLALACAAATAAAAPLAVCVDADDAPFSSAATPERGIDVGVAQALAERLERPLKLVWVTVPNRGGLGKALRQTLAAGECDAYLGLPLAPDMVRELAERQLVATGAYLGLGYLWVAAPGQPGPSAATLRAARKIGAVTATPADLYLHRMKLPRAPYGSGAALVAALRAGEVDLALLWSSALADAATRDLVRADAPPDDAELRTGLAVALRRADAELARQLSAAVDALRAEGRFDAIAARHGLPRVAPP